MSVLWYLVNAKTNLVCFFRSILTEQATGGRTAEKFRSLCHRASDCTFCWTSGQQNTLGSMVGAKRLTSKVLWASCYTVLPNPTSLPMGIAVVVPVMDRVGGHMGTVPTSPLHRQPSCRLITVTPERAVIQQAVQMESCPQLPQTTAQPKPKPHRNQK